MATSVKLDDDLKNRIQHLAEIRLRLSHWIMREAIRDYVEREEKRESFKQDALRAWEAYQENGLHLTLGWRGLKREKMRSCPSATSDLVSTSSR